MRETEYAPLLPQGFKDIAEADLHQEFVSPFSYGVQDHRVNLLIGFGSFLAQFKMLNLKAEIWIDGSFATTAPDPADVDVVFYLNPDEIEQLSDEKRNLFQKLFRSKKFIRNLYSVEVYVATMDVPQEQQGWLKVFGTCYDNRTPKGIFRMHYPVVNES